MNESTTIQGPDCRTCWKREQCTIRNDKVAFCSQWATREPKEPEHPDAWERGDEYPEWRERR